MGTLVKFLAKVTPSHDKEAKPSKKQMPEANNIFLINILNYGSIKFRESPLSYTYHIATMQSHRSTGMGLGNGDGLSSSREYGIGGWWLRAALTKPSERVGNTEDING